MFFSCQIHPSPFARHLFIIIWSRNISGRHWPVIGRYINLDSNTFMHLTITYTKRFLHGYNGLIKCRVSGTLTVIFYEVWGVNILPCPYFLTSQSHTWHIYCIFLHSYTWLSFLILDIIWRIFIYLIETRHIFQRYMIYPACI